MVLDFTKPAPIDLDVMTNPQKNFFAVKERKKKKPSNGFIILKMSLFFKT
jgi:hypothetical protein